MLNELVLICKILSVYKILTFRNSVGMLTQDISVVKLIHSSKTSTCIVSTIRAETASLPNYMHGEALQQGAVPPPLIGHSLTLIGKNRALLRLDQLLF